MAEKNTPLNDERANRRTPVVNDMDPDGMDPDTEGEERDPDPDSEVDEADGTRDTRKPEPLNRTH